jgi:cell division protein FtsI (penicillin-binding protein 3)
MTRVEDPRGATRLKWLARIGFLWAVLIAARLVQLQVLEHDDWSIAARKQHRNLLTIQPERGALYDRNGEPLAMNIPVEAVSVNPREVADPDLAAALLAPILRLDERAVSARIAAAAQAGSGYLSIKRKISLAEAARVRSLQHGWIRLGRESMRVYPKGSLAAHVLGSMGFQKTSGDREVGTAGLEQTLETELRGRPGRLRVLRDSGQRHVDSGIAERPVHGVSFRLSLDERIQHVAERALASATGGFDTGSILVMDPNDGAVLALANWPAFDPNEPVRAGDLEPRVNRAVMAPFEPGSVFKIVTLAAALETTGLRPESVIPCGSGSIHLFGQTIRDTHSFGALSLADVLARSSNVGAINVGLRVGEKNLQRYVRLFGFGRPTGLPLAGEESGVVRRNWKGASIAYVSMGHELSATTVQLGQAVSAIANGGLLVRPRLLESRQPHGGTHEIIPAEPPHRVLRPETAITMRRLMEGVVLHGTGQRARLAGYSAAGKTGSAQIYDPVTRRYTHRYNASFAGFAPVNRPAVVVIVNLHGARGFGGAVAAPLFRDVATGALRLMGVARDLPEAPAGRAPAPVDVSDLAVPGSPVPPPEAAAPETVFAPAFYEVIGPRVPDFRGKSMRTVLAESMALGMQVEVLGNGVARHQFPPAGSVLPVGERIRIQFAR